MKGDEMRSIARPISMVLLVVTLCGLAVGNACGFEPPTWFISFAIPVISALMIERAVRKTKGDE